MKKKRPKEKEWAIVCEVGEQLPIIYAMDSTCHYFSGCIMEKTHDRHAELQQKWGVVCPTIVDLGFLKGMSNFFQFKYRGIGCIVIGLLSCI